MFLSHSQPLALRFQPWSIPDGLSGFKGATFGCALYFLAPTLASLLDSSPRPLCTALSIHPCDYAM
jgi:hypothetical protein